MALDNEEVCRFCLKGLSNGNFEIIENLKLGMLDVLLLKLNFSVSIAPLVCNRCVESLKNAFDFKTACLSVERKINDYVGSVGASRSQKVDLKEVYLAQKDVKNGSRNIRHGQKVCRFCLRLFKDCVLNEIGSDTALTGVLRKYFPELNMTITKEISSCESCLDGLTNNFDFIMHCLDTENHIIKYYNVEGIPSGEQVSLKHVSQFVAILKSIDPDSDEYYASVVENGNGGKQPSNHDLGFLENESLSPYFSVDSPEPAEQPTEQPTEKNSLPEPHVTPEEPTKTGKKRGRPKSKPPTENNDKPLPIATRSAMHLRSSSRSYKCPHCPFQSKYNPSLHKHMLQHKKPSELKIYKCKKCSFETKHKGSYVRHILKIHKTKPVLQCDKCPFKTESKKSFTLHGSLHAKKPDPPTFLCNKCPYKTYSKQSLEMHGSLHTEDAESPRLFCEKCPYSTESRRNLNKHIASHRAKTYRCDTCPFKTEKWKELRGHKSTHRVVVTPKVLKCSRCTFTTRHKSYLTNHLITHMSKEETVVYRCSQCDFETKHKMSLRTHVLRHLSPKDQKFHECEVCGFKTRLKGNLKLHIVIHMDASQAIMYKCEHCDFQTKHKMSLRTHLLRHKKKSEVVRHRCKICGFDTLLKGNLKKHELIHKDPCEVTWYDCHLCGFETIHRESYKKHATSFHPKPEEYKKVTEQNGSEAEKE